MKKITKIEIENSRAYYDRLVFLMEKGENLLLYGENGSGKTSLYKSLNDFIQSFYSQVSYTTNRYKSAGANGEVMLTIGDYNDITGEIDNTVDYRYAESVDNTNVAGTAFLKALSLTKGFLNYKDLLKVYLYEDNNPNLFKFFIEYLLKDHVASAQGLNKPLAVEWNKIKQDVFNVYNRNEVKHKLGLQNLAKFEIILRSILDNLFSEVNNYLVHYFNNFALHIAYDLKSMSFDYGLHGKCTWKIEQNLRLKIAIGSSSIEGFTEGLNEARLSAIAICLYLSALKANPGKELHLMFLDDIFIGIDSSNRWAILEILEHEFKDFQIIMTTYDRSWYCLARNYLINHDGSKWKFFNLYSFPKTDNGESFFVPVMTVGTSAYDRAKEYLHGQRPVDLPAAANYFRKALEELISEKYLPKELFMSDDYSLIPGYKLTKRIGALTDLFIKIGIDTDKIMTVKSYLHPLIHPLSHYEEEAQVYRNELVIIEEAIRGLFSQIETLNKKCRLLIGRSNIVEIRYETVDKSYKSKYKIQLNDNLWLYKDKNGTVHLTKCNCKCVLMEGMLNGKSLDSFKPNKKMNTYNNFCYNSLDEALQKIYDYEVNSNNYAVIAHNDYDIVFRQLGKNQYEPFVQKRDEELADM